MHFNDIDDYSRFFNGAAPLSSAWMEPYDEIIQQVSPVEELAECTAKVTAIFFKLIESGDLQNSKMLLQPKINVESLNGDGMTALQVASDMGHTEMAKWLILKIKVSLDAVGINGFRAIHFAVLKY